MYITKLCNGHINANYILYMVNVCAVCARDAGGLEGQVMIEDQKKWNGKGSPPGAVGKRGTPYHQHC